MFIVLYCILLIEWVEIKNKTRQKKTFLSLITLVLSLQM